MSSPGSLESKARATVLFLCPIPCISVQPKTQLVWRIRAWLWGRLPRLRMWLCVSLSKLHLFGLSFFICKMGAIIILYLIGLLF